MIIIIELSFSFFSYLSISLRPSRPDLNPSLLAFFQPVFCTFPFPFFFSVPPSYSCRKKYISVPFYGSNGDLTNFSLYPSGRGLSILAWMELLSTQVRVCFMLSRVIISPSDRVKSYTSRRQQTGAGGGVTKELG